MEKREFYKQQIQKYCDILNTSFDPTRIKYIIQSYQNELKKLGDTNEPKPKSEIQKTL